MTLGRPRRLNSSIGLSYFTMGFTYVHTLKIAECRVEEYPDTQYHPPLHFLHQSMMSVFLQKISKGTRLYHPITSHAKAIPQKINFLVEVNHHQ